MTSKERYDLKRKCCPHRRAKEKARAIVRHRSGLLKRGRCFVCLLVGKTIWHHRSYSDPLDVVELCYGCHRIAHPRAMPHGVVI